jgi:hypothetical protein
MKKVTAIYTPHVHYVDGTVLNKITTDDQEAALQAIAEDLEQEGFSHGTLTTIYTVVDIPDPDIAIKQAEDDQAAAAQKLKDAKAIKEAAKHNAAGKEV